MRIVFVTMFLAVIGYNVQSQWQPENAASSDNGNIYHLNGQVGIGTTTPDAGLSVESTDIWQIRVKDKEAGSQDWRIGSSADGWEAGGGKFLISNSLHSADASLTIDPLKRVGIATTNPRAFLDVGKFINYGNLGAVLGRLQEGDYMGEGTFLGVRGFATQENEYSGKSFSIEHGFYGSINSTINFFRGGGFTGGYLTFNTNDNTEQLRITSSGYVGIGTKAPDARLTVNGDVHAKEVRVDLNVPGPDYVFEPDYELPSLEEVQAYINRNKHLPEVPSAKEMEQNGINLSEMNMILLKKVEELTLYVIDLKKENEAQCKVNVMQQKELEAIKSKIK